MKKLTLLILSLFLLTGCSFFKKTKLPEPPTVIETDYLSDDHCYLYYYDTLDKEKQDIYRNIYNCLVDHASQVSIDSNDLESVQEITNYVLYDHPEIFYFDYFGLRQQLDNTQFVPTYSYTKDKRAELTAQLEAIRNEFINSIDPNISDYDKLKYVYEFVINKCVYVEDAPDNQHITSSLLYNQTVCSGYVKAIQYLCNPLGINSAYIVGQELEETDDEYHAWNLIKLEDDNYYLDATWGDYDYEGYAFPMYCYFMFDSNQMLKLYKPTSHYETTQAGTYNYYKYEGLYLESYNRSALSNIFRRYKNSSTSWVELQFSDASYQDSKARLLEQGEIYDYLGNNSDVVALLDDDLKVLFFKTN